LCELCTGDVVDALIRLPLDVAELSQEIGRSLGGAEREPVAHVKPGSSPPIQLELEALRALIVHETTSWAVAVARDAREDLNTIKLHHARIGYQVKVACVLLRAHLPRFLALGPTEYRARSLGIRRAEGHPDDVATRYGDDYWTTRDGATAAVLLVQLHQRAWRTCRRHTTALPVFAKCPHCTQFALRRYPGDGDAQCMACHRPVAEEDLNQLRQVAARISTEADRQAVAAVFSPASRSTASR
jgi:hypothetical protein